jgi:hypothetical protein
LPGITEWELDGQEVWLVGAAGGAAPPTGKQDGRLLHSFYALAFGQRFGFNFHFAI